MSEVIEVIKTNVVPSDITLNPLNFRSYNGTTGGLPLSMKDLFEGGMQFLEKCFSAQSCQQKDHLRKMKNTFQHVLISLACTVC